MLVIVRYEMKLMSMFRFFIIYTLYIKVSHIKSNYNCLSIYNRIPSINIGKYYQKDNGFFSFCFDGLMYFLNYLTRSI